MRSCLVLLLGALAASPVSAQQQGDTVLVLGFDAPDGLDDAAAGFTISLRHAASQQRGVAVEPDGPTLSQVLASLGCQTATNDCLGRIAEARRVARLVFGSVTRAGSDVVVEISLYVHRTRLVEHVRRMRIPAARFIDIDQMREPARQLATALLQPPR
jgi:hypothetical protein